MWVMIIGHPGSGKNVVKDILTKDEFEYFECEKVLMTDSFDHEVSLAMSRLKTHQEASRFMTRKNIVTIHSVWTSFEVHIPHAKDYDEISEHQSLILQKIYDGVLNGLKAPDCVVSCHASTVQMSVDRIKMRGSNIDHNRLEHLRTLYQKFFSKIKIPLIEIDATLSQEVVQKNINFAISSIKAANLGGKTIWERDMFYGSV